MEKTLESAFYLIKQLTALVTPLSADSIIDGVINKAYTAIEQASLAEVVDHVTHISITDFNTIDPTTMSVGFHTFYTGFQPTNRPGTANYLTGIIFVHSVVPHWATIIATATNNADATYIRTWTGGAWSAWLKLWNEGNDGTGSGLDADTLDGQHMADIQTLLNAKQATITGGATTIDTEDLTATRALISNASGKVAVSLVTELELGRVHGVTADIQTQFSGKEPTLTISGLGALTTLADTDLLLVDNSGTKKQITVADLIAQLLDPAWTSITPGASWTNTSGTTFAGRKLPDGSLQIKGYLTGGTKTDGTTIGTLPVALRLAHLIAVPVVTSLPSQGILWIQADGVMKIYGMSAGGSAFFINAHLIPSAT